MKRKQREIKDRCCCWIYVCQSSCVVELFRKQKLLEDRSAQQGERKGSLSVYVYTRRPKGRAAVEFSIGASAICDLSVAWTLDLIKSTKKRHRKNWLNIIIGQCLSLDVSVFLSSLYQFYSHYHLTDRTTDIK